MKSPDPIENPVLFFGPDVAKDLTVTTICKHFRNAGKGWLAWNTELHLGMFKAMKTDKQPKDVRLWLYKQLEKDVHIKIPGLMKRYIRILDSDHRRNNFLTEKENFWQASSIKRGPRSSKDTYFDVVKRAAWCLIKQDITVKQLSSDVEDRINEIKSNEL